MNPSAPAGANGSAEGVSMHQMLPRTELDARFSAIVTALGDNQVDVAIFTSAPNIYYLTGIDLGGYQTQQALILTVDGVHILVVREIENTWHEYYRSRTWCHDWSVYTDYDTPAVIIAEAAEAATSGASPRLAMETDRLSISHDDVRLIAERLRVDNVLSASGLIGALRLHKSPVEIDCIRRAGALTVSGIRGAVAALAQGGTDSEAASASVRVMMAAGSSLLSIMPFAACGPESARAHASCRNRVPDRGGLVSLMMSGSFGRYQCPLERTFSYGAPLPHVAKMLDVSAAATEHVLERIQPGMTSHAADALARIFYAERGLEPFFINRLAYSFGVAYPPLWWENEIMQLRPNDDREIEPGMVFHVVPALHMAGTGYVNQSMPICITETGCEMLVDSPLRPSPIADRAQE